MTINIRKNLAIVLATTALAACSCGNKIAQTDMPGEAMSNSAGIDMVGTSTIAGSGFFKGDAADRVFFSTNSSDLNSESRETLIAQAAMLKTTSNRIVIEGHCDERGTREYNLGLGERRAFAAKSELCNQGVNCDQISTVSFGKERPEVMGNNPEAWAQNRRAVTTVEGN
jgi:peptidoglycan-associated lipoprotein